MEKSKSRVPKFLNPMYCLQPEKRLSFFLHVQFGVFHWRDLKQPNRQQVLSQKSPNIFILFQQIISSTKIRIKYFFLCFSPCRVLRPYGYNTFSKKSHTKSSQNTSNNPSNPIRLKNLPNKSSLKLIPCFIILGRF